MIINVDTAWASSYATVKQPRIVTVNGESYLELSSGLRIRMPVSELRALAADCAVAIVMDEVEFMKRAAEPR